MFNPQIPLFYKFRTIEVKINEQIYNVDQENRKKERKKRRRSVCLSCEMTEKNVPLSVQSCCFFPHFMRELSSMLTRKLCC